MSARAETTACCDGWEAKAGNTVSITCDMYISVYTYMWYTTLVSLTHFIVSECAPFSVLVHLLSTSCHPDLV